VFVLDYIDAGASVRLLYSVRDEPCDRGHSLVDSGVHFDCHYVSRIFPPWESRIAVASVHCWVPGLHDDGRTEFVRGLCWFELGENQKVGSEYTAGYDGFGPCI